MHLLLLGGDELVLGVVPDGLAGCLHLQLRYVLPELLDLALQALDLLLAGLAAGLLAAPVLDVAAEPPPVQLLVLDDHVIQLAVEVE